MHSLPQKIRELFAARVRYKATRAGLLYVLAVMGVGLSSVVSANNLLILIFAAMLAAMLISGLLSRLTLAGLELDLLLPEHIPAERPVGGRLFVRNQKWLLPSFSVGVDGIRSPDAPTVRGVYFPVIPGGATVSENVEVRFPRRGTYRQNSFAFHSAFPFGFLDKTARVTLRRETLVYPAIDPRPGFEDLLAGVAGEMESHYRGLGQDFYRIRPYEAFESARHVDWRASAHVGSLQVREFAREQDQRAEIFLDRDVRRGEEAWFEHAIACCAFLAWHLNAGGASVYFRSQGFSLRQPEDGDIYAILKYLALVYPVSAAAEGPADGNAYQVVFTPQASRFTGAGWTNARILSPESLPLAMPQPPAGA